MNSLKQKYEGILTFYKQYTKLNELLRTGWVMRHVPAERLESVSDHTLQVVMLAHTFVYELGLTDIDMNKLAPMAFLHDLAETIVGDISVIHVNTEEDRKRKHEAEMSAIKNILASLSPEVATYYFSLWMEFEEKKTPTAQFLFQVDKVDAVMKSSNYSEEYGMPELFQEFYQTEVDRKRFEDGPLKDFFDYLKEREYVPGREYIKKPE